MPLFDDIRAHGAAYRLTEEALYAETLREIEAGIRRDGLWAKALVDCGGNETAVLAAYIKLRVRSLQDEATLYLREFHQPRLATGGQQPKRRSVKAEKPRPPWRRIARRFLNAFMTFGLWLWVGIMLLGGLMWLMK